MNRRRRHLGSHVFYVHALSDDPSSQIQSSHTCKTRSSKRMVSVPGGDYLCGDRDLVAGRIRLKDMTA